MNQASLFAACQVQYPAEVASLDTANIATVPTLPEGFACQAVPLREEWVGCLETKVKQKFTKMYNCYVDGRDLPCEVLKNGALPAPTSEEHALYFLTGNTAKDISQILHGYASSKFLFGQTSACFILPRRTAEWNSRVVHMQRLGSDNGILVCKSDIVDAALLAKHAEKMSSNQHMHNIHFANNLVNSRMKWELVHDVSAHHGDVLTSRWHAKLAGLSSNILIDSGAQENFVSQQYLVDNHISYHSLSSAGSVQLGNGSAAPITGKLTISLSIRNYHTKVSMYVTELSSGIDAVLGEPWLRQTSGHLEYSPTGLSAIKVWKGVKRFTLQPQIVQTTAEDDSPLLSAMQCKKQLKKAKGWFLVNVMHVLKDKQLSEEPVKDVSEASALPPPATQDRKYLIAEARLQHLLGKYKQVFKDLPDGLPPDGGVQHTIQLTENKTPFKHPYRLSPMELEEAKRQIQELLAKGFIQPSQSPFGSPILFVQKKDGSLRMCIDYRGLNAITSRNRFPLPNIADLLDRFSGATVSSLDLASGYHQIRISQDDVPKTAFTTPFGHYEFRVLSFGLPNAPATFQAVMNRLFGHLHSFCVVYLDDILVFSKTSEEHYQHLQTVLWSGKVCMLSSRNVISIRRNCFILVISLGDLV